jgi:hypothetical protein
MATGTVSSITGDVWQQISTVTPTNGSTSATFSSISGYKTIMVVAQGIVPSAGEIPYLQFNGDSTAGNYQGQYQGVPMGNSISTAFGKMAIVYDVTQSAPHKVDAAVAATAGTLGLYFWAQATPITSITWTFLSGATFTGVGTITLYGIVS